MVDSGSPRRFRFIDLFAGIGGTRLGFESVGGECVMTSEWDRHSRLTYSANFKDESSHPFLGDIRAVDPDSEVPDHDLLLAGFPCQPFSIAGVSKKNSMGRHHGFLDESQGTSFFDIARILRVKRPRFLMLENVRNLLGHDHGRTFEVVRSVLEDDLGYVTSHAVVDASAWVPQRRLRLIIVGFDPDRTTRVEPFDFGPVHGAGTRPLLSTVLHSPRERPESRFTEGTPTRVRDRYTLSDQLWRYLRDYADRHRDKGNGFGFGLVGPNDRARTLSARYHKDGSEILVDRGPGLNPRRLTPRECARLMGFTPETSPHAGDWIIPVSDTQAYRQFGNSIVVPMVRAIAEQMVVQLSRGARMASGESRRR